MQDERFLEKQSFDYFISKLMEYPENMFLQHMFEDIKKRIEIQNVLQPENVIIHLYGGSATDVME